MPDQSNTSWKASPLTLADVVALAREHAQLVGLLIDSPPTSDHSEHGLAQVGARLLLGDATIVNSIVALGCGRSLEDATALPQLKKFLLAVNVLGLTEAKFKDRPLWPRIREEFVQHSELLAGGAR